MRHYVWSDCPICHRGDTKAEDRFCAKGLKLRAAALAEMKAIPKPNKKPHHSNFNPAMERHG
jgi:hypothetical protein